MNQTPDQQQLDAAMYGLLDRLVCNELDERSRFVLFKWLEADMARWRQCGLAFLEAQTWSKALSDYPDLNPIEASKNQQPKLQKPRKTSFIPRLVQALGLAICVMFAFGMGFVASHKMDSARLNLASETPRIHEAVQKTDSTDSDPLLASIELQPLAGSGSKARMQIPVSPIKDQRPQQQSDIPDYVRSQWERRGYQLSMERRYLLGNLPDGEQIAVPVQRLQANYVGSKVY